MKKSPRSGKAQWLHSTDQTARMRPVLKNDNIQTQQKAEEMNKRSYHANTPVFLMSQYF